MLGFHEVLRDSISRRIFILTVFIKFGFLYFLPNSPSALAPDEGAYSQITLWFSNGDDLSNSATLGMGLYESSRSLIIPAGILCKLGVPSLYAVRITSVIYGLLSILIFMTIVLNFNILKNSLKPKRILRLDLLTVLFFIFLPSHFLWSELGLRESASEFWILLATFFLLKIYRNSEFKNFYYYYIYFAISLTLAIGSRKQTAMVFIFAIFLAQLLTRINKRTFLVLGALFSSGVLGLILVSTPVLAVQKIYELEPLDQKQIQSSPSASTTKVATSKPTKINTKSATPTATQSVSATPTATQSVSATPTATQSVSATPTATQSVSATPTANPCLTPDQIVIVGKVEYICKLKAEKVIKKLISESTISQLPSARLDDLQTHFELNRKNAASALPESKCNQHKESVLNLTVCLVKELPYRTASFLFRPLFPFESGSSSYNLASLENYFWIILTIFLLMSLYQVSRRYNYRYELNFVFIFVVGFIVGSAIYEGNLGTAFRHKSSILWCLLLITYIYIQNLYASKVSNTDCK